MPTPKKARRNGTKKHSLSTLKIVLFAEGSQFRPSLRSNSPDEEDLTDLDFNSEDATKQPEAERPDSTGPVGSR
jgi:hypothetical protein